MSGRPAARTMVHPINIIYRYLKEQKRVVVWLYENRDTRLSGRLLGFDEFMNVVLDDVEEVSVRAGSRKPLGRLMLKGDSISLIHEEKTVQ